MKKLQSLLIGEAKKLDIEYITITVHPENIYSNKTVEHTGAKFVKTTQLGDFLRHIYLLKL